MIERRQYIEHLRQLADQEFERHETALNDLALACVQFELEQLKSRFPERTFTIDLADSRNLLHYCHEKRGRYVVQLHWNAPCESLVVEIEDFRSSTVARRAHKSEVFQDLVYALREAHRLTECVCHPSGTVCA